MAVLTLLQIWFVLVILCMLLYMIYEFGYLFENIKWIEVDGPGLWLWNMIVSIVWFPLPYYLGLMYSSFCSLNMGWFSLACRWCIIVLSPGGVNAWPSDPGWWLNLCVYVFTVTGMVAPGHCCGGARWCLHVPRATPFPPVVNNLLANCPFWCHTPVPLPDMLFLYPILLCVPALCLCPSHRVHRCNPYGRLRFSVLCWIRSLFKLPNMDISVILALSAVVFVWVIAGMAGFRTPVICISVRPDLTLQVTIGGLPVLGECVFLAIIFPF